MPGPNKNYGQLNADAVGSETKPVPVTSDDATLTGRFEAIDRDSLNYTWSTDKDSVDDVGNGQFTIEPIRGLLKPGATSGDAHIIWDPVFASWVFPTWDDDRATRMSFFVGDEDQKSACGMGQLRLSTDPSFEHIGMIIDQGSLYATTSDGTTETRTQLRSSPGAGQFDVLVESTASSGATLTVRKRDQSAGAAIVWEETHDFDEANLPSGSASSKNEFRSAWSAYAENVTAEHECHINYAMFEEHPP